MKRKKNEKSGQAEKADAKSTLIPKVRFPEFRGKAGWDEKIMSEIFSFKGNNSLSRDKLNYQHGTVKNIHYGDIHTKFSTLFDITKEVVPFINLSEPLDGFRADNDCAEGDVVFADASEDLADIGKCIEIVRLNGERIVSGLHTILARPTHQFGVTGFNAHLFKCQYVRVQIQKESQGAKVLGLSATRLGKIGLPIPKSANEQQKIAECLSSLDERIEAENQKLEALKTHKKGLMQQLFPGEGESVPQLRFPEFKRRAVWKERKISEILSKVSKPVEVEESQLYQEIGVRSHGKGIFHKEPVQGKQIGEKRVFHVLENALVLNIVFAWEQAVATTSISEKGMIASHRFPMFISVNQSCEVRFIKYLFLTPNGKTLLGIASPGGAGRNRTLGQQEFEQLKILIPNYDEQSKIANLIESIDDLITAQADRIESLKTYKKGLMQQLFPLPEEAEA